MKAFMDKDFLLQNETGKLLYHQYASKVSIFDFHNHLSAKEIYGDFCYENIAQAWLSFDHYKWRAMRTFGISEEFITGKASDYDKYLAFVKTVQNAIGNPLYHWTHLELQRYFQVYKPLSEKTAEEIWEVCNQKLKTKEFSIRKLLLMMNVKALCTTDDPIDSLEYHKRLKAEKFAAKVLPTFRPDKMIDIQKDSFADYMEAMENVVGYKIDSLEALFNALNERLDYFKSVGCLVSDHSLERNLYSPATKAEVDKILNKKLAREYISEEEASKYRGYLIGELGRAYAKRDMVMQLHIGALRNNSSKLMDAIGENVGCDCMNDVNYAPQISKLLNEMDKTNELPKTILYCLNPKDSEMLACMAGNFQGEGAKGKVQLGTAWWFNDHKKGIKEQIEVFASLGVISTFLGMLTDSRSYLSFPRHEYFRRILCNMLGQWMEDGEFPDEIEHIGNMVMDICYNNAKLYFDLN